ncbi:MAG: hypothetical protein RIR39_946 [Pseudomonadota bacterium]|jgi:hypothetical protein
MARCQTFHVGDRTPIGCRRFTYTAYVLKKAVADHRNKGLQRIKAFGAILFWKPDGAAYSPSAWSIVWFKDNGNFKTLDIERLRSKATKSALSLWERAGVRLVECRFTSTWFYTTVYINNLQNFKRHREVLPQHLRKGKRTAYHQGIR